jgi:hypothetical protein
MPMNFRRLLRVFRAITRIKAFGGVKAIITTLFKGSGQILTVLAMLIFFMSAFAIAGMSIFGLSFRRRCVTIERAIPACTSDFDSGWGQTCNFTRDARGDVIDGEWGMAMNPGGDIMTVISPLYPHPTESSCVHSCLSAPLACLHKAESPLSLSPLPPPSSSIEIGGSFPAIRGSSTANRFSWETRANRGGRSALDAEP